MTRSKTVIAHRFLEQGFRSIQLHRFVLVAIFRPPLIHRHVKHPAAPFLGRLLPPFGTQKKLQIRQEKLPELTFVLIRTVEIIAFQEIQKVSLREVLRLFGRVPPPADIGVDRIPVDTAEFIRAPSAPLFPLHPAP